MAMNQTDQSRLRSTSNRFVEPASQRPRCGPGSDGCRSIFFEGGWPSIKARLEMRGWSPSQIEQIHEQLRQGWTLTMAVRHVALLMGRCPLRSRPMG
ncbi:hypothetical protein MITS9509_02965 [Synechococcus sp. MIT S9509]|nr:hypothetical protein [Synechococcus sp. MIT S9509]KZR84861.1 hypothetical protein MITS9504_02630 [Synechococcus sp. MIT S9504]KZR89539.1 hypothetical protein MITS9509_02965 [Synechococcus sp. MIT S9509]